MLIQLKEEFEKGWHPMTRATCPACDSVVTFYSSVTVCKLCKKTLPPYRKLKEDVSYREAWYRGETDYQIKEEYNV